MAATFSDIRHWFQQGVEDGASHMVVVCDTFDHEDYPVYVHPGEDVREVADRYAAQSMQRVMEVYALWKPMEPQLSLHRVFDYSYPDRSEEGV